MYVAFFDLDHTILRISSGEVMFRGSRESGIIGPRQAAVAMIITILYRAGFMSADSAVARWTSWYGGLPVEEMAPLAVEWGKKLEKYIRNGAREAIRIHHKRGDRTVILSASSTAICEHIRSVLGMDDVICTELEVIEGRLTGRLKGAYCHGPEKLRRARKYCEERGFKLGDAHYYADSMADLPVLEAVGTPVCVSPDRKLDRIARSRGWKVCLWQ